ncbi:MAG: hypothetical protein JO057_26940, partial [Chloroflexi bacterium]|nr:hypothetical protein [Chloroflexota bacterium]
IKLRVFDGGALDRRRRGQTLGHNLVAEDSAQTDELRDASIFGTRPRLLEWS